MINFKDITEEDKNLIQEYTLTGSWQNCDLSFPNLVSWRFLYDTQYSIIDDYLIIRFWMDDNLTYMMPIPKPQRKEDGSIKEQRSYENFPKIIEALVCDTSKMGQKFSMLTIREYIWDIFEKYFPNTFEIIPNRDRQDYIYLREKLISLSGKKLQSKRNHVNKFKTLYPNYVYKELSKELIPYCLELSRKWRGASKVENYEDEENLLWELRAMKRALNRWEKLGYIGGAIFVDDKMIAFSYGCPINQNTFDVCVEKADISFSGAFNIINQEFAKHIPKNYIYLNREEDLGDEGLRKAKLSYRPEYLLDKCIIREKNPLFYVGGEERIKKECSLIWKEVFNDPAWFINLYFSRIFRNEDNICSQVDGKVVAALQILPYKMLYFFNEINSSYVSGVSCLKEYRKQGIANSLLKKAHLRAFFRGDVFSILIPADTWLQSWYSRHGYAPVITSKPSPCNPLTTSYEDFIKIQRQNKCIILHSKEQYEIVKKDISLAGKDYSPQSSNIQGMLRIINAKRALELYAQMHQDKKMAIRLSGDEDISMNNSYFLLENGIVKQSHESQEPFLRLTINELAELIFKGENLSMCLMLN